MRNWETRKGQQLYVPKQVHHSRVVRLLFPLHLFGICVLPLAFECLFKETYNGTCVTVVSLLYFFFLRFETKKVSNKAKTDMSNDEEKVEEQFGILFLIFQW